MNKSKLRILALSPTMYGIQSDLLKGSVDTESRYFLPRSRRFRASVVKTYKLMSANSFNITTPYKPVLLRICCTACDILLYHNELRGDHYENRCYPHLQRQSLQRGARSAAEKFAAYNSFDSKAANNIRLLTEELVGMAGGIMEGFKGDLWFGSEKTAEGTLCRICLSSEKLADCTEVKLFLSVASSGKNENAKGLPGRIREVFRVSAQYSKDNAELDSFMSSNDRQLIGGSHHELSDSLASERWRSMMAERNSRPAKQSSDRDEPQKSMIGSVADDVKVRLKSDTTQPVIEKLIK